MTAMRRICRQPGTFGTKWALALLAAILLALAGSPGLAHEEHRKQRQAQQAAAEARQRQLDGNSAAEVGNVHEAMGEMMADAVRDRSRMSFAERLLDWLGRTHPIIVHFPIAFFPAALFTAVVGRRRPGFAAPVQFLVVAGGIVAPVAALFGWLSGGFTLGDADPLLAAHRWIGTGIGVGGLLLAVWAWRRPWEDRGAGMILALAIMTVAIVVQGWLGGALVHGREHMQW